MKRNGFTLIELIAVLVILSIITMMAAPNIVSIMKSGNEESFVAQAGEVVDKATYMYKTLTIRNNQDIFNCTTGSCTIPMANVDMKLPEKDSYGYTYNINTSYISFTEPSDLNATQSGTRTTKVFIVSCKDNTEKVKCHCIKKESAGIVVLETSDIYKDSDCNS